VLRRQQGDIGEASAIAWLAQQGALTPIGNWAVAVCTRGGNQSWNKIAKRFDRNRCDYIFVQVGDGRRWFIPAARIEGETSIVLGGRKYAQFEIEPGPPLPAETVR
jgi:hypothetical protein